MALAPTMRAFCALNLDIASVRKLEGVAAALRGSSDAPPARWVPPTRMHVTLKFLGDVDVGIASALADAIAPLARRERGLRVEFARLTGFPVDAAARTVVAELRNDGALQRLAERVEEATSQLGFEREDRPYRPHVTLARLLGPAEVAAWLAGTPLPVDDALATEIVLYRSDFATTGHEYAALARYAIGG